MFRLRKIYPPYGTETTPLWEHAYSERVKVVDGLCEVQWPATRDYLLHIGYELAEDDVPPTMAAGQRQSVHHHHKPRRRKEGS